MTDAANECIDGDEIDAVEWDTGWPIDPGVALGFDEALPATEGANDAPEAWCAQATSIGGGPLDGLGTPGESNDPCAP